MNDLDKPKRVFIEREGRRWHWGQSGYLRVWNGFKFTANTAVLKSLMFPIGAIICGIAIFSKNDLPDHQGKVVDTPQVTDNLPIVESRILTEMDLTNGVRKPSIVTSPPGRIQVFKLRNSYQIPVGSEAKAILESGATNGIVKAKLLSAINVDGESALPESTIIFGRGRSTEERLFVEFQKAIFPDGDTVNIRGQAFDASDKILGLKGAFIGSKTKKMAMGMGLGFIGGMAAGLQDTSTSFYGTQQQPTIRNAALAGASKATLDQSQLYLDEIKNSPNIIEVPKGREFYLIIDEPIKQGD